MKRSLNPKPEPITIKVAPHVLAALKLHEQACYDLAFKGSQHPDDWEDIEKRWERSRAKLLEYLQY